MAKIERHFNLIVIGKMKDKLLDTKAAEFQMRLNAYGKCTITTLPDSDVEKEGKIILRELSRQTHNHIFVLSEEGKELTTVQFAETLEKITEPITLVIGGPFGLSPAVKQKSDMLLSLSKMTFTHEFARVLLLEQLYRAMNFLNGGSYHHI